MSKLNTVQGIKEWLKENIECIKREYNIECPENVEDHDAQVVLDTYSELLSFITCAEMEE